MSHPKYKVEWIEEVQEKEAALQRFRNEMQNERSQQQMPATQTSTVSEEDDVESFFFIRDEKKLHEEGKSKSMINSLLSARQTPWIASTSCHLSRHFFLGITPDC